MLTKTGLALCVVLLSACSSSSTSSTSDAGGGGGNDSGGGGNDSGTGTPLNGCTSFTDDTAATSHDIAWSLAVATDARRCLTVKVGTTVTWKGSFTTHPLGPKGGDTPNPIVSDASTIANAGTPQEAAAIAFTKAGTFGYICGVHSSMTGAIKVVP